MDNSYLSFDTGIDDDRVYAHRGDIFICDDLFKTIDEIDKDDHILGKPTRPVIIISNDCYNRNIVKVLPFSTKAGSMIVMLYLLVELLGSLELTIIQTLVILMYLKFLQSIHTSLKLNSDMHLRKL